MWYAKREIVVRTIKHDSVSGINSHISSGWRWYQNIYFRMKITSLYSLTTLSNDICNCDGGPKGPFTTFTTLLNAQCSPTTNRAHIRKQYYLSCFMFHVYNDNEIAPVNILTDCKSHRLYLNANIRLPKINRSKNQMILPEKPLINSFYTLHMHVMCAVRWIF